MTVHIAASLVDSSAAVIYADSQSSTSTDEVHGAQKLYAGEDYLIGCAGSMAIIQRLFQHLDAEAHLDAKGLIGYVEKFVVEEIRPESSRMIDVVAITPSGGPEPGIQRFTPSLFLHFGTRTSLCSIGSGAEFVYRAMARDSKNGIPLSMASIVDLMVTADSLAEAANESLTVDDLHMVGLLRNGRTYLLGHRDIKAMHLAPALQAAGVWTTVSHGFEEVRAIVDTIKSETIAAQQNASLIRTGGLQAKHLAALQKSNGAVAASRAALEAKITDYCDWYDKLLSR